ncbi:hypothetical protein [uncultured Jatrophihabitans sp.]|uniref:hypothetical protein n=1 Tax=uncultured Jatrophihabitans sp. TaxID=1610747 RepID=UPI0035CAF13E
MFVVVLTDEGQQLIGPRAVGPFDNWDDAQQFALTLVEQWKVEDGQAPAATVTRIEAPLPGVVVGEIQ